MAALYGLGDQIGYGRTILLDGNGMAANETVSLPALLHFIVNCSTDRL